MKCIFAMSPPVGPQCLDNNTPENEKACDDIKANVNKWSGIMMATAAAGGILAFFGKYSFALLGENITFGVRQTLYKAMITKHMGWHDDKLNSAGSLTSVLASEVNTLNGVSTASVSVMLEACFAMLWGISLAFYFCWQEATVALCMVPIMVFGSSL
jgi:ATP-binding cassette subfamily B (MDR/TAP) protein 1